MLKESTIKIQQASDFLNLANEAFQVKEHSVMKNNLEAFITFSRSALHMIFKDLKDISRKLRDQNELNKFVTLKRWMEVKDKQSKEDMLVVFFVNRRDYILKQGTLELILNIEIEETFNMVEEIKVKRIDSESNLINVTSSAPQVVDQSNMKLDNTQKLFFKDWEGEEDVFDLCRKYFERLSALYLEAQEYLKSVYDSKSKVH